ncbi:MAG: hypothetical protein KGP14_07605 [Betaproteobacteria bacterium]|nr:hypothetical protein [Betaproteobacteria bacterium]
MTDTVSYDEHKAFLKRQREGALAEYAGFANASVYDEISTNYYDDPHMQARYELGFRYGKAMLRQGEGVS